MHIEKNCFISSVTELDVLHEFLDSEEIMELEAIESEVYISCDDKEVVSKLKEKGYITQEEANLIESELVETIRFYV